MLANVKSIGNSRSNRKRWLLAFLALVPLCCSVGAWLVWPFWQLTEQFGAQSPTAPSRLYGRSQVFRVGDHLDIESAVRVVEASNYRHAGAIDSVLPGTFYVDRQEIVIFRRRFSAHKIDDGGRIRIEIRNNEIVSITNADGEQKKALLEPPLIASFYGDDPQERRPTKLDELPEDFILAVLAAEDPYFLEHAGVSLWGTLRAAWINLREQSTRRAGSTLTHHLVRSTFLGDEPGFFQEICLVLLVELRYDKRAILQVCLNETYWGNVDQVKLIGVGAASLAYFDKTPIDLDLSESALLAGIIRSPPDLSPILNPEAAKERRDFVLGRLAEFGWLAAERLEQASQRGIEPTRVPLIARHAPYFVAAVEAEARRRFGIESLADAGYVLQSTLSIGDQEDAEEAVRWGVEALEQGWEKDHKTEFPLEAALISADPRTGAILAYVGGRDFASSQFDRVADAQRQAGSAFKPVVYATAYADRLASPATFLEDTPLSVRLAGQEWSPRNSDGKYQGRITSRAALEQSLNVPTVRLALEVGLDRVIETARRMGMSGRIDPYPALALGAMEVSPAEMATVYATLAAGGRRPTLHTLTSVYDRLGVEIAGQTIAPPVQALDENVAWVVNKVLQGVLDRGTAKSARQQNIADPLAGKTGTTKNHRDSWFAGYSPERLSLVWVGYDDNSKTRLSGARAALPIWSSFTDNVRPPRGYSDFTRPDGAVMALIDPTTGGLATNHCPRWVEEVFVSDFIPALCLDHSDYNARPLEQPGQVATKRMKHPFRRWMDMLRAKKSNDNTNPPP